MIGIIVTLAAVLLVICLAFCHPDHDTTEIPFLHKPARQGKKKI